MNIILEGTCGSGKSTLAKKLSERYGMPIIHSGGPMQTGLDLLSRLAKEKRQMKHFGGPYIFDRCIGISSLIYQPKIASSDRLNKVISEYGNENMIVHCNGYGKPNCEGKAYYTDQMKENVTGEQEFYRGKYKSLFSIIPHYAYDFQVASGYYNIMTGIENGNIRSNF